MEQFKTKAIKKEKSRLKEIRHQETPTLIIPPIIKEQIDWLHDYCGHTEWSGMLIYTVNKGSISKPASLILEVQGIYLLDIGTPGYTDFSIGERIIDVMEEFPKCLEEPEIWKMGKIHTHHNMNAYHSSTDIEDLHANAPDFAYYLSLVVNIKENTDAYIAVHTKEKNRTLIHKDGVGGSTKSIISGEEMIMLIKCIVEYPVRQYNVLPSLKKNVEDLEAKKKENEQRKKSKQRNLFTDVKDLSRQSKPKAQKSLFETHEISGFMAAWCSLDVNMDSVAIGYLLKQLDTQFDVLPDPDSAYEFYFDSLINNYESIRVDYFGTSMTKEEQVDLIESIIKIINKDAFDIFDVTMYIRDAVETIENRLTSKLCII